jgi:hypothetical protein
MQLWLNYCQESIFAKTCYTQAISHCKKNFGIFPLEFFTVSQNFKITLPCLQELATRLCPVPSEFSPRQHTLLKDDSFHCMQVLFRNV